MSYGPDFTVVLVKPAHMFREVSLKGIRRLQICQCSSRPNLSW